jgi:hypothetical protein
MSKLEYKAPELEVTRFDVVETVLTDFGGSGGDGNIVTKETETYVSSPETSTFGWDQ